jgi:hypothetical protein
MFGSFAGADRWLFDIFSFPLPLTSMLLLLAESGVRRTAVGPGVGLDIWRGTGGGEKYGSAHAHCC